MSLAEEATKKKAVPLPVASVNIMKLPLSPFEGFVFTRVDGNLTVSDIADTTASDAATVWNALVKLYEHRAITWKNETEVQPLLKPSSVSVAAAATASSPAKPIPASPIVVPAMSMVPPAKQVSQQSMPRTSSSNHKAIAKLTVDELRVKVESLFPNLEGLDHYQLLNVKRNAEKAEIKKSYFELSKIFHPDTQYSKDIGGLKKKMEAIFKRLTQAYDVLSKSMAREAYDALLAEESVEVQTATTISVAEPEAPFKEITQTKSIVPPKQPSPPIQNGPPRSIKSLYPRSMRPQPIRDSGLAAPPPQRIVSKHPGSMHNPLSEKPQAKNPSVPAARIVEPVQPSVSEKPKKLSISIPPETVGAIRSSVAPASLKGLATSLRATAMHTGGMDTLSKQLASAKDLMVKKEYQEAISVLRFAQALAPTRMDIVTLIEEAERLDIVTKPEAALARVKELVNKKEYQSASRIYEHLAKAYPDVDNVLQCAKLKHAAEMPLDDIQIWVKKALEIDPNHTKTYAFFADVLFKHHKVSEGRSVLQKAHALSPSDPKIAALVKKWL